MSRIILITFGVLGWAWYELSGGSDFEPGSNGLTVLARVEQQDLPAPQPQVSRTDVSAADLTGVGQPNADQPRIEKASLTSAAPAPQRPTVAPQPKPEAQVLTLSVDGLGAPAKAEDVFAAVDYRAVTGSRVNLRSGPSTEFDVVTQLRRGNEVEVLRDEDTGWVKLRAIDGNHIGWMSEDFLTAIN